MCYQGQTTTFQVRLEIMEQAANGLYDTQIATALGCSLWTVRKWRRRALEQGRVALVSHMGRPATGPVSTFPIELKEAILHLRQLHPGWGPATLLVALQTDPSWRDQPLPSRAQIARLLKQVSSLGMSYPPFSVKVSESRTGRTYRDSTEYSADICIMFVLKCSSCTNPTRSIRF